MIFLKFYSSDCNQDRVWFWSIERQSWDIYHSCGFCSLDFKLLDVFNILKFAVRERWLMLAF